LLLPLPAIGVDSRIGVELKIEKLDKITELANGKIRVIGCVEQSGEFPYSHGMTIFDAVNNAGGLNRAPIVGKTVTVKSPSRGYRLTYSGIYGSSTKEKWKEFYATILIAEGDTIYIHERVL